MRLTSCPPAGGAYSIPTLLLLLGCLLGVPVDGRAQVWSQVWADEFDGTALDPENWVYDIGTGAAQGLAGWGNNELQYYRDGTNNLSVADGILTITAKEEDFGGRDYTSARIRTSGLQAWNQGRIEARIKLPIGQGIWPAFWMLRDDPLSDPNAQFYWPGEIDVMELVGHQPSIAHGTAHYGEPGAVQSNGGSTTLASGTFADDFHIFAIEWYEDRILWFLDGVQYHTLYMSQVAPSYWLFDQEYHLLLNVAVGGNWPGSPDGTTVFPAQMEVDYVRVYELESPASHSVTFQVDMGCENGFSAVGLESPNFGWCGGCVPLSDPDDDGIWSTTIDLPSGDLEYKYSVDAFAGQEDLIDDMVDGASCAPVTDYFSYANRLITISDDHVQNDTYGTCGSCESAEVDGCMDASAANYSPEATIDDGSCLFTVTFLLDMGNVPFSYSTPEVNGTFNDWCGLCNAMSGGDSDGDGVWMGMIDLPMGEYEFKFSTDNWNEQESLTDGSTCTLTTGEYINRTLTVDGVRTYGPVAWNACPVHCPGDMNTDAVVNVNDFLILNSGFGVSCSGCVADLDANGQVDVGDLLIFNSAFGQSCD